MGLRFETHAMLHPGCLIDSRSELLCPEKLVRLKVENDFFGLKQRRSEITCDIRQHAWSGSAHEQDFPWEILPIELETLHQDKPAFNGSRETSSEGRGFCRVICMRRGTRLSTPSISTANRIGQQRFLLHPVCQAPFNLLRKI
jgi:hypothetical protein